MSGSSQVFLTGASGTLGRVLAPALAAAGHRPVLSDIVPFPDLLPHGARFVAADLTDPSALDEACPVDATAIVHFGGINNEREPETILEGNILGTTHVFELARRRGARVVFASSNHAIGFHPRTRPLTITDPYRPDGYYGLSKVYAEMLGRMFYDKHGVESVHLRIGSCLLGPRNDRHRATWLSYPDLIRLVDAAVTAPRPGYAVVWGISRNANRWWTDDDAARIGFEPQDDAERFAASLVPEDGDRVALAFQGGSLCSIGYSRAAPAREDL